MNLKFHHKFNKHFEKLPHFLQEKTDEVIKKFLQNPFDPSLLNHPLHCSLSSKRSLSVNYQYRILFEEHGHYQEVLFLDVGTHDQVY